MSERLDIKSTGGEISIFKESASKRYFTGIYVKDSDGLAVFYANKEEAQKIMETLKEILDEK